MTIIVLDTLTTTFHDNEEINIQIEKKKIEKEKDELKQGKDGLNRVLNDQKSKKGKKRKKVRSN